ncbi:hypothetical protein JOB18_021707 [Solea senegalensis]|uniref:Uncharacterized protein n=1 Tax=Solea senegalensis TaxID=28829 RepID=A0AAV6RI16_SOLSE|nr:hypothetical protein JOB18_021707 [Solea senegalensis]
MPFKGFTLFASKKQLQQHQDPDAGNRTSVEGMELNGHLQEAGVSADSNVSVVTGTTTESLSNHSGQIATVLEDLLQELNLVVEEKDLLQQQLESERKSHTDTEQKTQQLIQHLRTEVDNLHQEAKALKSEVNDLVSENLHLSIGLHTERDSRQHLQEHSAILADKVYKQSKAYIMKEREQDAVLQNLRQLASSHLQLVLQLDAEKRACRQALQRTTKTKKKQKTKGKYLTLLEALQLEPEHRRSLRIRMFDFLKSRKKKKNKER